MPNSKRIKTAPPQQGPKNSEQDTPINDKTNPNMALDTPQGILHLQRTIGNQAVMRRLKKPKMPSQAPQNANVIQRRWLFVEDIERPVYSYYFWEDDGTTQDAPPAPWAKTYTHLVAPQNYVVEDGSLGRFPRGKKVAMTWEHWVRVNNYHEPRQNDNYNPFGRFNSSGGLTAFLPSNSLSDEQKDVLIQQLGKKDKNFKSIQQVSPQRDRSGYPLQVTVTSGETLSLASISEMGAVYAQNPAQNTMASYNPSNARPSSELSLKDTSSGIETIDIIEDETKVGESRYKTGRNMNIDSTLIGAYQGQKRSQDQGTVMGESARDVALNAGFDPDEGEGWEWLHMIAHSMGGIDVQGPQVAGNLVAGTGECNTQMIIVEEFIKDIVQKANTSAQLFVSVEMFDHERQIGRIIKYDVQIGMGTGARVFQFVFDCLSRQNPLVSENRDLRYAGRALFNISEGLGGFKDEEKKSKDNPLSELKDALGISMDIGEDATEIIKVLDDFVGKHGMPSDKTCRYIGQLLGMDLQERLGAYLGPLTDWFMHQHLQGLAPFIDGIISRINSPTDLTNLLGVIAPFFGGLGNIPGGISNLFFQKMTQLIGPEKAQEWRNSL